MAAELEEDFVRWGESYELTVTYGDNPEVGDPVLIPLDETYSVFYRVRTANGGGDTIEAGEMTIADGAATVTLDTGATKWRPGFYFYDVRIVDPEGKEHVSTTTKLEVGTTQTNANPA